MKQVTFLQIICNVSFHQYPNGRTAIQLSVAEDSEPMATATVNVPSCPLGEGKVLIKDYAENEGMLACLTEAGIVEPTGETIPVGHAEAHVCRLLETDTTH